jgi:hypothetical protein
MDGGNRYSVANAHQRFDGVGVRAPTARSGVSGRVASCGDHSPNIAIALAVAFINSNDTFLRLLQNLRVNEGVRVATSLLTFILGAGFYIRAAQLFPRKLTPDDIVSSPTIWAKMRPLRVVLIFFLRASAVWVFVTGATLLTMLARNPDFSEAIRLVIVLTGVVYFYLMYRAGDVETRRKVLWFFEAALASLVISLVSEGVRAVLHGTGSPTLRVVLSVFFNSANYLALVICISAAVFYAGAISPALVIRKTFIYGATAALLIFTLGSSKRFSLTFSSTWRVLATASQARSSARCSPSRFIRLRTAWSMCCSVWPTRAAPSLMPTPLHEKQ